MRRILRTAVVALVVAAGGVAAAPANGISPPPSTLQAGQQLVAGTSSDRLASVGDEYELAVGRDDTATIWEYAYLYGSRGVDREDAGIWLRENPYGGGANEAATLRMQTDGNLVLRTASGKVLWASNTARTGTHNYLTMQTDGNLVIYTSARKAVWASHTVPVLLAPGEKLMPGRWMVDTQTDAWGPLYPGRLTMQSDGNLVLTCGSTVHWQTNTHVAGSFLSMQTDGNLVLRSPNNTPLWASHTQTLGSYSWFKETDMSIYSGSALTPKWSTHPNYPAACPL